VRRFRALWPVDHAGADHRRRRRWLHAGSGHRRLHPDAPEDAHPRQTSEFAINASKSRFWEPPVKRYVEECLAGQTGPRETDFNMRWIASLVAETLRVLMRGGVILYPADTMQPQPPGRISLMYEANPIAFLIEQAGGEATDGRSRILEQKPRSLQCRTPLIFGSGDEVTAHRAVPSRER
jgi:fructose-1,6-bisphosphatase